MSLSIRPYSPSDREAVAEICVRTGAHGNDATGVFSDDAMLPSVYVLPYVDRHPDLSFVLDKDGTAVGYIVATDNTDAFYSWFNSEWWPPLAAEFAATASTPFDQGLLANADAIGSAPDSFASTYPAHLHIDLLPDAQGGGWGRKMVEHMNDALRARGVSGVHWTASALNTGALAFYDRLGFERLESAEGAQTYGAKFA